MDATAKGVPHGVRLQAVEHHHFMARGRCLLFDVNALTVLPSCLLDRTILELAANGMEFREIVEKAMATGADPKVVSERLKTLMEHRFLLPPGEKPHLAELRKPTSYVTFMLLVWAMLCHAGDAGRARPAGARRAENGLLCQF